MADGKLDTLRRRWDALAAVFLVLSPVLVLGGVEDWYGKTDAGDLLGSDAVQYLDCARAMARGDWRGALNAVWCQGYPALLAAARLLFPVGMSGEWLVTRAVNLAVLCFSLGSFAYLMTGLRAGAARDGRRDGVFWGCGAAVFVVAETCLGHVSRVNPDELVAGLFVLACGLMLRLLRGPKIGTASGLGFVLGFGFLVKAVFLPLGCAILGVAGFALWWTGRRWMRMAPAVLAFGAIVLGYGAALSWAVGYRTLGESGGLNYAWRVDRLSKWVHWEGGVQSAEAAWPRPWMARFARWESDPPDFGAPVHASEMVERSPTVYVFHEPVQATYIPYYDLAYWYRGYRPVFRWRYQALALGRSLMDLMRVLMTQPLVYAVLGTMWWLRGLRREMVWPLVGCSLAGVAIYLPVYLEGRYINGPLMVMAMVGLSALEGAGARTRRAVLMMVMLGAGLQMVKEQRLVWSRAVHGWNYRANVQWKVAEAVRRAGVGDGAEVGMISWTPNVQCDWAYLAGVRITSEIADGADETLFWRMVPAAQDEVLGRMRGAGARAVLSWDGPPGGVEAGWTRLGETSMWVYRF